MPHAFVRLTLSLLGLVLLLASCSEASRIERQLKSWRTVAPRSYEFEFSWQCFCPGAGAWWRVIVDDGLVTSARIVDSTVIAKGGLVPPGGGFPTVDSVFVRTIRALSTTNASVQISYDPEFHYPLQVAVDRDRNVVDDEWSTYIRNFRVRARTG